MLNTSLVQARAVTPKPEIVPQEDPMAAGDFLSITNAMKNDMTNDMKSDNDDVEVAEYYSEPEENKLGQSFSSNNHRHFEHWTRKNKNKIVELEPGARYANKRKKNGKRKW